MRFDTLLLAGTVSAAAATWPGETTVTVTVCETAPAPSVPTPSVVPTPTAPVETTPIITSPVESPTVPAIPSPTAGAIPNQMKASMAGLLGFLLVGLAAL
ncbi:hypothetical protein ACRE_078070 [Hapsidospora chrysogenum ATCC 11550]|uniref:Uncharacterized protein n=1 Tax=Hapsidospora chrysogenum (strain ATCC 11550 / CBS 779.69 / DSM 880 / IAM 14645 / JCM 23072 / IMI 49137) TaxID=857340 RepID=A0A086SWJ6_HAPC1|nr:hypothetical protein ACRE_078070 [Hapsidospora chrysogenum ATCC 11550]